MKTTQILNPLPSAVLAVILVPTLWAAPVVSLQGPSRVDPAASFEVEVYADISPDDPLIAFGFNLSWSPDSFIWDVAATRTGPLFDDVSEFFHVIDPENPGSWVLDVAGTVGVRDPVAGDDVLLAIMAFTAKEKSGYVRIHAESSDPDEGLFTLEYQYSIPLTRAYIQVPETTSTAWLLAIGFGCLVAWRVPKQHCSHQTRLPWKG